MLVHYFGSSKGLFDRIINEFVRREMTRATALTDKALQQENSLLAFVEAYVTALVRPQASGLVGTLFEVYGITILGSDVAKDSLDTLLSHWLLQIDRVLKKQELDSTLQLQTVVMAACNGFVLDQLATSQKERIKLSIEAFVTNCVASNSRQLANANKI